MKIHFFLIQESNPFQTEKTLSLIDLIQNGGLGGQIIIGLLVVLLLVVVYIYFERLFAIRAVSYTHLTLPTNREV